VKIYVAAHGAQEKRRQGEKVRKIDGFPDFTHNSIVEVNLDEF
jgi:hypothetical protein